MLNWLKKYSKWATMFVFGVALIAVYKTFNSFSFIGSIIGKIFEAAKPFIIAFVVAYMLNIPAKKLDQLTEHKLPWRWTKRHSGAISIALIYVLFIAAIVIVISALVPALYNNILEMYNNLPKFVDKLVGFINSIELLDKFNLKPDSFDIYSKLYKLMDSFDINSLGKYAQGIVSFTTGLVDLFIALIASVYMLIDKDRIVEGIRRLVGLFAKKDVGDAFMEHCSRVNMIFKKYVYSRLICCIVMAIACSIILALMGEKYALLLGIFIGFMDMIPYFGSIISWIVCAVVMIFTGGIFHSIWCSLVMLVMQQIDGNILAPKVMGSKLDIRPLVVIIAVSAGGTLFGFVGMLISVPVVAILRAIISEFILTREKAAAESAAADDGKEK